jgi:acetyltransferase-like isoleucine patch superfamily enzyme
MFRIFINMVLFFDRVRSKIVTSVRKYCFLARTKSYGTNCKVLGEIRMLSNNLAFGENFTVYPNVCFWGDGEIIIGDNVSIGDGTIIFCKSSIRIGNDVAIAAQSYVIDCDHGIKAGEIIRTQPLYSEPIEIGNDVWIAAGCKILKGAKINDGAVIGANSLVNSEIPVNAIAFGCPAKVHTYRK